MTQHVADSFETPAVSSHHLLHMVPRLPSSPLSSRFPSTHLDLTLATYHGSTTSPKQNTTQHAANRLPLFGVHDRNLTCSHDWNHREEGAWVSHPMTSHTACHGIETCTTRPKLLSHCPARRRSAARKHWRGAGPKARLRRRATAPSYFEMSVQALMPAMLVLRRCCTSAWTQISRARGNG